MRQVLAIARREVDAYFAAPIGWLCLCGFVVVTGFFFALMTTAYSLEVTRAPVSPYSTESLSVNEYLIPPFFQNTSVILLLLCPALSMRLFAEDRKQGSIELLLSSPVSTTEIVLGKYLGALGFLVVLLAGTLYVPAVLYWLGDPDPGVMAASYAGTFLLAAAFMAVGMLASAFTENQVVALVLSFGLLLVLWVIAWVDSFAQERVVEIAGYVSMLTHHDQILKGLLHLKDVAYYVTFIAFFLFATCQRVEAYRWQ